MKSKIWIILASPFIVAGILYRFISNAFKTGLTVGDKLISLWLE